MPGQNRDQDNWGQDPVVRQTREIFASLEQVQKALLQAAHVSPFDGRLRAVREAALSLFERAAACADGGDIPLAPTAMVALYKGCLQQAMAEAGMPGFGDPLSEDRLLQNLIREVCG